VPLPLGPNDLQPLSWDITITDPSGQFELTPANSDANVINILTGTDLTASATELTYNFSFDGGLFLIESPHIGANGPFWCLNAGGTNCWGGALGSGIGVSTQGVSPVETFGDFGSFIVGTVSTTPLPMSLPLFASGLGLIGFLARRGHRHN
jgi:hypothetical protein